MNNENQKNHLNLKPEREVNIDVAKGLAIIFMVLIHVQEYLGTEATKNSPIGLVITFLGSVPAAPIFMISLGIGIFYSRKQDYRTIIKRGFRIFATGYALNFFRASLPSVVGAFVYKNPDFLWEAISYFFNVDILQFAGLAFIFMGIAKKYRFKQTQFIASILLFSVLNYYLKSITIENPWMIPFTSLLWGSSELSFFPFLTWIIYPVSGYMFASYLKTTANRNQFYARIFFATIVSLLLFAIIYKQFPIFTEDEYAYYHHGFVESLQNLSMDFLWISVLYFVSRYLPTFILGIFTKLSKYLEFLYPIHWVIIGWLIFFNPIPFMSTATVIFASALILFVSYVLAKKLKKSLKKNQ